MNDDVLEIRDLPLSKLLIDKNLEYGQVRGILQSCKLLLASRLQLKAPTRLVPVLVWDIAGTRGWSEARIPDFGGPESMAIMHGVIADEELEELFERVFWLFVEVEEWEVH